VRWEQGRAAIDRMLADGELQRIPASREQADRLLAQAQIHVASALKVCDADPHLAVSEAVRAQLDPPMGRILRQFNRMRTRRHDAEYPPTDSPEITPDNVREDQGTAVGLIDLATRLIDEMSPF
jgi:hypothetical protein